MSYVNKFILVISSIFVKLFTFIVPRDEGVWIFGSWFGKRYSDNPRYLFEFLSQNKKRFGIKKLIWVTNSNNVYSLLEERDIDVYKINSFIGSYYHLRAKFFVFDQSFEDVNPIFTKGGIKVNLWHGIPLKKIGYHYKDKPSRHWFEKVLRKLLRFDKDKKNNCILAPSFFSEKLFKSAFEQEIIRGPYPRNLFLCDEIRSPLTKQEMQFIEDIKSKKKKVIFYLPTFRDKCELKFLGHPSIYDSAETINKLSEMGYQVVTKLHSADPTFYDYGKLSNVTNLPPELDIYPILKVADILITDYSSVYFDYLYLDKEIIFFPYDLDYYENFDRGLILDYEKFTPGCKVFDTDELLDVVNKIKHNKINFHLERKKLKTKVFDDLSLEGFINELKNR